MKYTILEAGDHAGMEIKVNKALAVGWKPQGGIAAYTITQRDHNGHEWMEIWFMQAMIKETEK